MKTRPMLFPLTFADFVEHVDNVDNVAPKLHKRWVDFYSYSLENSLVTLVYWLLPPCVNFLFPEHFGVLDGGGRQEEPKFLRFWVF